MKKLMVHPDFQNRGLGRALLAAVEEAFPKEIERFELFTGHKSLKNIALYKKHGYREFKEVPVNQSLSFVYLEKIRDKKEPK